MRLLLLLTFLATANALQYLVTFDGAKGATTRKWRDMNDPVMGGVSNSTWNIDLNAKQANWQGEVKIVPKLSAPGFCNAETTDLFTKFNDASGNSHLLLRVRTSTPNYIGYKVSLAADTLNPQFKSFKANYNITVANAWTTVAIPFTSFSNDWSAFTGNCDTKDPSGKQHVCCSPDHPEVCLTQKNLRDISVIGLWTEGVAGKFHLEVQWIAAGNSSDIDSEYDEHSPAATVTIIHNDDDLDLNASSACKHKIGSSLKYNVSHRLAKDYLPGGAPPTESLATAVCCDPTYTKTLAEPQYFFDRPDVALFDRLDRDKVTTFYDSSCSLPIFKAPLNRTFAQWRADSEEHGWPSFRAAEVVMDNVIVHATGEVVSKCGTHLGTNLPDAEGERLCVDLVCISGHGSAVSFSSAHPHESGSVVLATFDGAKSTTYPFEAVNDPVMGGQSESTFNVDHTAKVGEWSGEVKVVPFLHAPGFCNLMSPGLGKTATYADATGTDGITVVAAVDTTSELTHFNVMLNTRGAHHLTKTGTYTANITLTANGEFQDAFVPWSAFGCFWRGQPESWCPKLSTQLDQIDSIGMGTAFPGTAGMFSLRVKSFSATTSTLAYELGI